VTDRAVRLAVPAMGTRFELVLLGGRGDLRAAGEAALEEIETWHQRLNRFAHDSLVSHINRTAADAPVRLDADAFGLFDDAVTVWRASGGAFDITVAPLMARQGFGESAVATGDGCAAGCGVRLDSSRWTIALPPGVSIDLGGIAKGHALDCAAAILRGAGVTSALLHGGTSSVVAIGGPQGGHAWRIAIGPEPDAHVVALRDTALSVSDPAGHCSPDTGAGHIVDPRTGRPAAVGARVAVIGRSARLADAWSTALVVLQRIPSGFPPVFTALFSSGQAAPSPRRPADAEAGSVLPSFT
jgi:thiamine biosynthesis lipoprotein